MKIQTSNRSRPDAPRPTPIRAAAPSTTCPGAHSTPVALGPAGNAGFTMAEIAIALGVIGFALIAIIGLLPRGLQVQRDNRAETIINQDAVFWLEAIRGGAQGVDDLTNYVERIDMYDRANLSRQINSYGPFLDGQEIIQLLSIPAVSNVVMRAEVMAISGSAAEKEVATEDRVVSFKYQLEVEMTDRQITGVTNSHSFAEFASPRDPTQEPDERDPLVTLTDLRLTLSYPLPKTARSVTVRTVLSPTLDNAPGQIPVVLQP